MSEATTMAPLEIGLIDEGSFLENLNAALLNAQQQMIQHTKLYGPKAAKAKATVKADITLICLNPDDDAYGCVAQVKTTLPAVPPAANMLMGGTTQTGEACLLCRKSGSSQDHPNQMQLCTGDGRSINQDTGEILGQSPDEIIDEVTATDGSPAND